MLRPGAGISGDRCGGGGGIGGSFESSGTRVLGTGDVSDDEEPEFVGELDVDEDGVDDEELAGEVCSEAREKDLEPKGGGGRLGADG